MKVLRLAGRSHSPLAREEELFRRLLATGVCGLERLHLTITGRRVVVDGFVGSVDQKFRVEKACRELVPGSTLVNRLRVAVAEEGQLSLWCETPRR